MLDDCSRYLLAWRLSPSMATRDIQDTLDIALQWTGVTQVKIEHQPHLLSDNGPGYVSNALRKYLKRYQIRHVRGAPHHPMTQGKIERYHRSLKNVVKLDNFHFPWELETAMAGFVDYYNHHRYHEALDNLTPADVYHGGAEEVRSKREEVKQSTLQERRRHNLHKAFRSV